MDPLDDNPLPCPTPSAVFRRLQEGGVLYSTETEVYFGVGNVGAHIWEFLPPETRSFGELVARLSTIYRDVTPTQIRADVERFIAELLENGLVAYDTTPPGEGRALDPEGPGTLGAY
ncbi:MAG: PqqD family protein [Gemmatimonadaceae bacterium]|nr:PqqD family protein [Gemmatimonadaceae bacterium]